MQIYQNPNDAKKPENNDSTGTTKSLFAPSPLNFGLPLWEKLSFFLIGFLGFQFLGSTLSASFANFSHSNALLAESLVNFLTYTLIAIGFILFLFLDKRKTWKTILKGFTHLSTYGYAALFFFLMLAVNYAFTALYTATIPFYGSNANEQGIEAMAKAYPALIFFPIVLFAPLCEELTYRVGLVDTIGHKNRILGVLISAVIFGFIHFDFSYLLNYYTVLGDAQSTAAAITQAYQAMINEFLNLPVYILMGMILAFAYTLSGNLSTSMTLHFANNLFTFIAILAATSTASSNMMGLPFALLR